MVCWLRFLKRVFGALGNYEPNRLKRKALAIDVLKQLEREEGHDVAKIGDKLDREGDDGILKRAKDLSKREDREKPQVVRKKKKKILVESASSDVI